MTSTTATSIPGFQLSSVLDPHWRDAMARALDQVFEGFGEYGEPPTVALVGWQAATLIGSVYERASRVVIIEADPEMAETIQRGVVAANMGKKVTLRTEDPASVELDSRVDLAVYGAASTWFMEGPDAAILSNVRANVLKKKGVMVPRRFVHLFELANPRTEIGGISLRAPRFSRPGEPVPVLSESKHFGTTDLTALSPVAGQVDDTIIVKPLLSGRISALRLNTLVELADGVTQVTSQGGVQSIIVPLREDIDAKAGQPVSIHVRYAPGEGLATTRFSARALVGAEAPRWEHSDHEVVETLRRQLGEMMDSVDRMGRASDLDKVVSYTLQPHGDVNRLTALFWTIDDEFRKPLRAIVENFRRDAAAKLGQTPSDEVIYDLMLETYRAKRGEVASA